MGFVKANSVGPGTCGVVLRGHLRWPISPTVRLDTSPELPASIAEDHSRLARADAFDHEVQAHGGYLR